MTKMLKRELGLAGLPGDLRKCVTWTHEIPLLHGDMLGLCLMSQGITRIGGSPEVTNQLAVDTVAKSFARFSQESDVTIHQLRECLEQTMVEINERIPDAIDGVICSLSCLVAYQDRAFVADIGANRVYHLHRKQLQQISINHAVQQDNSGSAARATILTEALGMKSDPAVNYSEIELVDGDEIIICNDGIWRLLAKEDLESYLATNTLPKEKTKRIVKAAKEAESKEEILPRLDEVIHDYHAMAIRWQSV